METQRSSMLAEACAAAILRDRDTCYARTHQLDTPEERWKALRHLATFHVHRAEAVGLIVENAPSLTDPFDRLESYAFAIAANVAPEVTQAAAVEFIKMCAEAPTGNDVMLCWRSATLISKTREAAGSGSELHAQLGEPLAALTAILGPHVPAVVQRFHARHPDLRQN